MGCDEGGGFKDSFGEGQGQYHARWEVDLQHGTGMEESSHSCIKGHHSKKAFLYLETHMLKSLYVYCIVAVGVEVVAPLPPVQTLNTSNCTPYS